MMPARRYPLQPLPLPVIETTPPCLPCPVRTSPLHALAQRCRGGSRLEFSVVVIVAGIVLAMALAQLAPWLAWWRETRLLQALSAVRTADLQFQLACGATPGRQCDALLLDGLAIAGIHGHPSASVSGIAALARLSELGLILLPGTLQGVPALTVVVPSATPASCTFTYVQPPMQGAVAAIESVQKSCH